MKFYEKYILPKVVDCFCRQKPSMLQRQKVVPQATGNVLEIGIGSGLNLPFYNSDSVNQLIAIDPSIETWKESKIDTNKLGFEFQFIEAFAENVPFDSNFFDSVVITYALCTIPDTDKALEEIRRVLKPNGKLIFCEHGKAPDKVIQYWQNLANPIWKQFSGGCNINKEIPKIIQTNGFKFDKVETMYIPGWKPASFNYWGVAKSI